MLFQAFRPIRRVSHLFGNGIISRHLVTKLNPIKSILVPFPQKMLIENQSSSKIPLDFEYSLITKARTKEVIDIFHKSFVPKEPTANMLGVDTREAFDYFIKSVMNAITVDQVSLMAVEKMTTNIAGFAINLKKGLGGSEETEWINQGPSDHKLTLNQKRLNTFFRSMYKGLDMKRDYGVDKIFTLDILDVNANYKKRGIGFELSKRSEQLAIDMGFEMLMVHATSQYTYDIFKKMGNYKIIREIDVCKFEFPGGHFITPEKAGPHRYSRVLVRKF